MHRKRIVPIEIEKEVQRQIADFNRTELKVSASLMDRLFPKRTTRGYSARLMGKYLYLDRADGHKALPVCRLTWKGSVSTWEFSIFTYSSGKYDPVDLNFRGREYLDGTVIGAMKAGMEAFKVKEE